MMHVLSLIVLTLVGFVIYCLIGAVVIGFCIRIGWLYPDTKSEETDYDVLIGAFCFMWPVLFFLLLGLTGVESLGVLVKKIGKITGGNDG